MDASADILIQQETRVEAEKLQKENLKAKEEISSVSLAHTVMGSILDTVNKVQNTADGLPHAPVGAAAPKSGLGASLPTPPMPPLPGFDPNNPCPTPNTSAPTTWDGKGYEDQLHQLIDYVSNHPNDPAALASLMSFVTKLSEDGLITPNVVAALDGINFTALIDSALHEFAIYAFFLGYGNPPVNGKVGMDNYINAFQDFLTANFGPTGRFPTNKYINEMIYRIGAGMAVWADAHTDDKGNLFLNETQGYYYYDGKTGQMIYRRLYWPQDKDQIEQIISNTGLTGAPDHFWQNFDTAEFQREYRELGLQNLLNQFKADPLMAISLWMMTAYDKTDQGQMGGLAGTTDLLTKFTNEYATPLAELAGQAGSMTGPQAMEFARLLFDGTSGIDSEGQLSSLASTWDKNVFKVIGDIKVDYELPKGSGNMVKTTLGVLMVQALNGPHSDYDVSADELAAAFQSLVPKGPVVPPEPNPTPPNPVPPTPDPTNAPDLQTMLTALQQGGSLLTNQSKTVATQISAVTSADNAVIKFGYSLANSNGGGPIQLNLALVQNQISR